MVGPFKRHALIDASVEDVWSVISDPETHPDWWPEVENVESPKEGLSEGDAYLRRVKRYGFGDVVDNIWVAERLEHLKEAHFRCTVTGTYARFSVTPARDETFLEVETGMLPMTVGQRLTQPFWGVVQRRWIVQLLDALPDAVRRRGGRSGGSPQA